MKRSFSLKTSNGAAVLLLALLVLVVAPTGLAAGEARVSALWGRNGEAWDPNGRLPDFSRAGYHEGVERYPLEERERAARVDVSQPPYSADRSGARPASAAIQQAIDDLAARPGGQGGVIYLPAGTYLLPDRLLVHGSRMVLKGDGPDRTVLSVPQGLREHYPDRNCRVDQRRDREVCDRQVIFGGIILVSPNSPASLAQAGGKGRDIDPLANPEIFARAPDLDEPACDVVGVHQRGDRRLSVDGPLCWRHDRILRPGDRVAIRVRDVDSQDGGPSFGPTRYLWEDFSKANYSTQPVPLPAACNNASMSHMMKPAFRVDGDVLVARVAKVDRAAKTVELDRPLRMPTDPARWQTRIDHAVAPIEEVAIIGLTIRYPDRPFTTAQLSGQDRGENGIYLDGVDNCLVEKVRLTNVELGLFAHRTRNCTFKDIDIDGYPGRPNADREMKSSVTTFYRMIGKTGLSINGLDNLLRDVRLHGIFAHDLSISQIANGNVISRASGPSLSIDHHGKAPFENLYTNIDSGEQHDEGTGQFKPLVLMREQLACPLRENWPEAKLFGMGGSSAVTRNMGVRNTYWNIRTRESIPVVPMHIPGNIRGPLLTNVVGLDVAQTDALGEKNGSNQGPWLEPGFGRTPNDIYEAQIMRKSGRPPVY